MIGTNDIAWWTGENAGQIGARHNALIDQLRVARPNAWDLRSVYSSPGFSDDRTETMIDRAVLTQQLDAVIPQERRGPGCWRANACASSTSIRY